MLIVKPFVLIVCSGGHKSHQTHQPLRNDDQATGGEEIQTGKKLLDDYEEVKQMSSFIPNAFCLK